MSARSERPARPGTGRAIRWLLAVQIAIAGLLLAGDFLRVLPRGLGGDEPAPSMETEVRPGDQTRRFAPRLRDGRNRPGFAAETVPSRLTWADTVIGGEPALRLTGEIVPGDGARFAAYLDGRAAPLGTVALHSPGGSVADALAIGRRIRAEGLATRIEPGAACFSACPYMLAGGTERTVGDGARVGVHQHIFGENTVLPAFLAVDGIQRGQADVMAYLDAMGVSPLLMEKAMRTPPEDIYILLEDELTGFALATEPAD